jgi:PAS domain S-box-containing protein
MQPLEGEKAYKLLFENAPDAVVVIDTDNNILFWNPKAEAIFGWHSAEVFNYNLSQVIVPQNLREAHNKGMKRFLATGVSHVLNKTIEVPALHKNGTEFFISLTISQTVHNDKIAFLAFIRDITEQKKNALELERTLEALSRSNASLEEFAHAASHDLKEPIRKIHIFTDRLKHSLAEKMTPDEITFFERMEMATKRMTLLIDDMLEFSHVSLKPHEKEDVDLNEKLKRVLEDLEVVIEEKKAQINYDGLPVVKGYSRQLQQLFQNMVGNALKYTKPDVPPIVHIKATKVTGEMMTEQVPVLEKGMVFHHIIVQDNGIGFDQIDAQRIFQMFQRLHGNAKYKGTGVGLSIARKVVENHDGYIWAEGAPDQGAQFHILLPE